MTEDGNVVLSECAGVIQYAQTVFEGLKAYETEDGRIVTSKNDRKNHGFGIHNIETAAYAYGGELTVSCEERPYGFLFLAEVVFPVTSEEPSDISSK